MNIHETHRSSEPSERLLPFSGLWPLLAGATIGILLRFVFSDEPGGALSAMSGTFVISVPLIVGVFTVFVAERIHPRSWGYYAAAGAIANVLFVIGTLVILIEGMICAILIAPLFALLGAMGGLLMGAAGRISGWLKRTVQCCALLPVLLLGIETHTPLPQKVQQIEHSILIEADDVEVWERLQNVHDIEPSEVDRAWVFRIGVPTPKSGESTVADVPLRRVTMGKNVHFDQIVEEVREYEYVKWSYRFYEDSFPPHAMDDHVKIGGHYFDLIDTSYSLDPEPSGTRRTLRASYRLSTRFNWYASPIVRFLLENAADVYPEMYRDRALGERTP